MRERLRAGRMEKVFSKVSPEETPSRAIERKTNISLIAAGNSLSSRCWWTASKNHAVLDQGHVSEEAVSYKDDRAKAEVDS